MESESRHPKSALELLHDEHYTPDDVARLLDIGVHIVRHAAFTGELRARILGHHVLSLQREDVVTWFLGREKAGAGTGPISEPPRRESV
jgi:hypothetical protein